MKKLLTDKDMYGNCVNIYSEDYTSITVKGEPRDRTKQSSVKWHNEDDYVSLQLLLEMLGLEDYVEMELDEGMLYMRIMEEAI